MAESEDLRDPWLVAVWPGMGNVALGAGTYLVEKLGAKWLANLSARDLFDIDHVEVKRGVASSGRMPRSMIFGWKDPLGKQDLLIFIGETQPSRGGYAFCHKLLDYGIERGVKRFFTFAALATQLHPTGDPRVFSVITEKPLFQELSDLSIERLEDGQISGLNGVLLAAGAERGLEGICLLGELPFFAVGVPNPKASQAVLRVFTEAAGIDLDFDPINEQAKEVDQKLVRLLERMQRATDDELDDESFIIPDVGEDDQIEEEEESADELDAATLHRIENLFDQARRDRSKALQLKQELDRLGVFQQFEDRFLDLFRKAE